MESKLKKYHENYVSRRPYAIVSSSPNALIMEEKARELEASGKFRQAASKWLDTFDMAISDIERSKIAIRREQCITRSNRRRFTEAGYEMAGRFVG